MNKSKKFLEFIKSNPPPCLPGDRLYWFRCETGEILQDKYGISNILLDDDWNWRILDENELITPNEDGYFCITPEDAKRFRDTITDFRYAILTPSETGDIKVIIDHEKKVKSFKLLKVKQFDVKNIPIDESYFQAISKIDSDVKSGRILQYFANGIMMDEYYMVLKDGTIKEIVLKGTDKKAIRTLEDIFD